MANNGCNNPPLPEDWVKTLLNGDPSPNFVGLCEMLERAGYTFGRSDFARALVSDVPPDISDRDSEVNATNGDHQIASPDDTAVASDQSRGAINIGLVHDRQHSTPAQKKPRGRPKKTATSGVTPNPKGKNAAITPKIYMPEVSAQSTLEDIKSPKSKNDLATDTPAQPTVHDSSKSSPATSPMYPPSIPKGPTPQSVNHVSSGVQPEPSQPDKHPASPLLTWNGPPSSYHPPFQSQPLFFNDDISYTQDPHDKDASAPQVMTHKIPQSAQLSEATNNQPGPSDVGVTNYSSHPKAQAPTDQYPAPSLSARQHVEQHRYVHNPLATPTQMAPVAPMVGMPQPPAPPAHQEPVNPPVLDTAPLPEMVPDISQLPPVLMLLGKEKVVKKISKRKAARVSTYDPKNIARDVLLATGRHPNMAPLNSHLFPLLTTLSSYIDKDSDLETLRWDLIDPVPEGTRIVELLDEDDEDLVMGDLEPVAQSSEKDLTPSPPRPREPRSRRRWKKQGEEGKGSESKQEKGKERRKGESDGANTKLTPTPSNPPPAASSSSSSSTRPKPRAAHPRASLGGLLTSAVATDKGRRATMSGALSTDVSMEKNTKGVENEAAAPPRPRPRGPRMRLVGPPVTPRAKPEETTPKAGAWTPVNKAETSISPRSKLAAVVIQSRTPSAAEPGENLVQAKRSGKRKNEDPEGSIRPRKRAPIVAVDNGGSCLPSMFNTVKCGWKDCRAQLHTIGLLRKHTAKVHKHKASFGGYPCYWEGCSRPMASGGEGKGPGGMKEKAGQYLDLDTEKQWEHHIESAHISGLVQLKEAGEFDLSLEDPCLGDSEC